MAHSIMGLSLIRAQVVAQFAFIFTALPYDDPDKNRRRLYIHMEGPPGEEIPVRAPRFTPLTSSLYPTTATIVLPHP